MSIPYVSSVFRFSLVAFSFFSFNIYRRIVWFRKPLKHPSVIRLARFGRPIEVLWAIHLEQQKEVATLQKNIWISESWLVYRNALSLEIANLSSLAWAYPHVTGAEIVTPYEKDGELRMKFTGRHGDPARISMPIIPQEP